MNNISNERVYEYASFVDRAGAMIIDMIILIPIGFISFFFMDNNKNFELYTIFPFLLFHIWYWIYLVKRYGGTPGKLIMKIKITKLDYSNVGYKEAILRDCVLLLCETLSTVGKIFIFLNLSNEVYLAMSETERFIYQSENMPSWASWLDLFYTIWIFSELIIMLTNKKRRALHDFMAGTVVIKTNVKKKITQEFEYTLEENENNFKLVFLDSKKSSWKELKFELEEFYKTYDFAKIVIDKENSWMLKSDSQQNAYINLCNKDNIITLEVYNSVKPDIEIISKYL